MRQLKGKVKETKREKQERRRENRKIQNQLTTVVLPTVLVIVALIATYVYLKTRPGFWSNDNSDELHNENSPSAAIYWDHNDLHITLNNFTDHLYLFMFEHS